uniref:non-specific serine/threonine protein kinase n=1 Tax=Arcella intermedia TaxID=1963864 RepID=A0A6B2KWI3_9EUKA|eukprot:TRINITY_DN17545_c0_g1_i1.p1 TRINITY_DN17545_c0_g1~~TRINITY_DN17545_c0_g1_i1.p1  ORF type:complete len:1494 (-),score=306.81 TRINITY_DN17545_c0_g1_i1:55-4536(-)
MGNHLSSSSSVSVDIFLNELNPPITKEGVLGKGRFLRTLKCFNDEGLLVCKIYVKEGPMGKDAEKEEEAIKALKNLADKLKPDTITNVYPFQEFLTTDSASFMSRQYFHYNLHDRFSARPFLTNIDKLWLTYQLIKGVEKCHENEMYHGDIKTENVMLTNWNWLYLTDFAPYKPDFIPEDNPADFSYFFDSSAKRKCYIAPERFQTGDTTNLKLSIEDRLKMDVFSLGCTIAELWMEGDPLFTYSELLSYKKGTWSPTERITQNVSDKQIQDIIMQFISLERDSRPKLQHFLENCKGTVFPVYFDYLHTYIWELMFKDPDSIVDKIDKDFDELLTCFEKKNKENSVIDRELEDLFNDTDIDTQIEAVESKNNNLTPLVRIDQIIRTVKEHSKKAKPLDFVEKADNTSNKPSLEELYTNTRSRLMRYKLGLITENQDVRLSPHTAAFRGINLWTVNDVCKWLRNTSFQEFIPEFLKNSIDGKKLVEINHLQDLEQFQNDKINSRRIELLNAIRELKLPSATYGPNRPDKHILPCQEPKKFVEGFIIILDLICNVMRSVQQLESKLKILRIFSLTSPLVNDECRLQRIIPYLMNLFKEGLEHGNEIPMAVVVSTGIRTLTHVIGLVKQFPTSDALLFPDYLLPVLLKFAQHDYPVEIVQHTLAVCLPSLADSASRFVEATLLFKGMQMKSENLKTKSEMDVIRESFKDFVELMLARDSPRTVKIGILSDLSTLCTFFGQEKTNDLILPLVISCLNDRDGEIKSVFFQNIIGICSVTDPHSVESFILPCVLEEIYDEDEYVLSNALNCLNSLCSIFCSKDTLLNIASRVAPLLFHPNSCIRYDTVALLAVLSTRLSRVDLHCFLIPILRTYLCRDIVEITEDSLMSSLLEPISRPSLIAAITISFEQTNTNGMNTRLLPKPVSICSPRKENVIPPEEVAYANKIGELNLRKVDESKLLKMRDYIEGASKIKLKGTQGKRKDLFTTDEISKIPVRVLPYSSVQTKGEQLPSIPQSQEYPAILLVKHKPLVKSSSKITVKENRSTKESSEIKNTSAHHPAQHLLPCPLPDLGTSLKRINADSVPIIINGSTLKSWHPQGILVAHFQEHSKSVNCIEVSDDNLFFASGSSDGVVKIWDCQRLGKSVSNKSQLTLHMEGSVNAITSCNNTHSIACGTSNGSIHVFRIDCNFKKENTILYKSDDITCLNKMEGGIVALKQFPQDHQSLLVYATDNGTIGGWDLRSSKQAWLWRNKVEYGVLQTMAVVPSSHWLSVGTQQGCINSWDLRWGLPFQNWRTEDRSCVHCLVPMSCKNNSSVLVASGPGLMQLLDLESGQCTMNFMRENIKPETTQERLNIARQTTFSFGVNDLRAGRSISPIRTILQPKDTSYILTAGSDLKIRYWDTQKPECSYMVSSTRKQQFDNLSEPGFGDYQYKVEKVNGVTTMKETLLKMSYSEYKTTPNIQSPPIHHHDIIMDMKCIEYPSPMLISGSRDGVIKVWI